MCYNKTYDLNIKHIKIKNLGNISYPIGRRPHKAEYI